MKRWTFVASALLLLGACATRNPSSLEETYQVDDSGIERSRAEAESRLASSINEGAVGPRDLDAPLKVIHAPLPEFPVELRDDRSAGSVRIRFTVRPDGTVANPAVVGPAPAAMAAISLRTISRWKFEPPMRGGRPTELTLEQKFVFALK